ncbi:MAG: BadF/BadG/BcrA/BcrD ATPase family protein [bacterium]
MPNIPTYIGFDGGGSTSRFLIKRDSRRAEEIIYRRDLKYTDIGIDQSAKGFADCLNQILEVEINSIRSICVSLSGASDVLSNNLFAQALRRELELPTMKLHIESDSTFTLNTAYPTTESGMLLIAGTGSVVMAKTRDGKQRKIGGFGRLLGDEGSGHWIGVQALKHYLRVIEQTETKGILAHRIENILNASEASSHHELRKLLHDDVLHPSEFAPIVFDSLTDDGYAKEILYDAGRFLMREVEMLWEQVQSECDPKLVLFGGIATQEFISTYIREDCDELGIACTILDAELPLKRALSVAESLSD